MISSYRVSRGSIGFRVQGSGFRVGFRFISRLKSCISNLVIHSPLYNCNKKKTSNHLTMNRI